MFPSSALVILLFGVVGILSVYLNLILKDSFPLPGLFYTSATIFLFAGMKIKMNRPVVYYLLMILTYAVVWIATVLTSWFAFIGGILTAGAGALLSFMIMDKLIYPLRYNKNRVFAAGGVSFLITDILIWSSPDEKTFITRWINVEPEPHQLFGEVFFFWQLIVGTTLYFTLRKNKQ